MAVRDIKGKARSMTETNMAQDISRRNSRRWGLK